MECGSDEVEASQPGDGGVDEGDLLVGALKVTVTFVPLDGVEWRMPSDAHNAGTARHIPCPDGSATAAGRADARRGPTTVPWMHIESVAILVDDYDAAIVFFVDALGFELVEDTPSFTNDGRPKRWVVVRPPGATTAILLARADGERQSVGIGDQLAGRVGFFLRVDDFHDSYRRMVEHGVRFLTEPTVESYGTFAVFLDIAGNKWDLLG